MTEEKRSTILCVDDTPANLDLLDAMLSPKGYALLMAESGQKALDILDQQSVDLVILDILMPGMSGFEVAKRIKARKWVPIILLTSSQEKEIMIQGLESGADEFLNKPVNKEEMLLRVSNMLKIKENQDRIERMLALKTEFTSTVSHELRTPLASIKMAVDMVISGIAGELTADQKRFLSMAKDSVDRLHRLINDILDLTKLEAGRMPLKFVTQDIRTLIDEIIQLQSGVAREKGLYLKLESGSDIPPVAFDKDRMVQVLSNLVGNSMKFTDKGGITVAVTYLPDSRKVRVAVSDTGPGIREEDMPKLFQKFQQLGVAELQVGGTGLGLAICKEIISRHGGEIWAESRFGEGTSFIFLLPIHEEGKSHG